MRSPPCASHLGAAYRRAEWALGLGCPLDCGLGLWLRWVTQCFPVSLSPCTPLSPSLAASAAHGCQETASPPPAGLVVPGLTGAHPAWPSLARRMPRMTWVWSLVPSWQAPLLPTYPVKKHDMIDWISSTYIYRKRKKCYLSLGACVCTLAVLSQNTHQTLGYWKCQYNSPIH